YCGLERMPKEGVALKGRQIKSTVTGRAPGLIPTFEDTRSLPSAALTGSHINIQDPGFRFSPPWAEYLSRLRRVKIPSRCGHQDRQISQRSTDTPPSRGRFCCRSLHRSDSLLNQKFLKFVG